MAAALALPAAAQNMPRPGDDNPRLQTVVWQEGQPVVLTALPLTALMVVLDPTERISRLTLSNEQGWTARASSELNSFLLTPVVAGAQGSLEVQTDRRTYFFNLATSTGLEAALLVRFVQSGAFLATQSSQIAGPTAPEPREVWGYRIRGDRSVRPESIGDDGQRTRIGFAPDQPLPAVFAIGPTGEEEIVNGHMRNGFFEIDRVHEELVFRIDKDRARAFRNDEPDSGS